MGQCATLDPESGVTDSGLAGEKSDFFNYLQAWSLTAPHPSAKFTRMTESSSPG